MAENLTYCRAVLLGACRSFAGWKETADEQEDARRDDDTVVYVHASGVVTRDIFEDRDVVVSQTSGPWLAFCRDVLGCQAPDQVERA